MSKPQDNDRESADDSCEWLGSSLEMLRGRLDLERDNEFRAHLETGCAACVADLEMARELQAAFDAARFVEAKDLPEPPDALRTRVLHDSRVQTWRHWTAPNETSDGLITQRATVGDWEPTALQGISVRQLAIDAELRYVTMMVRMAAGTSYPAHRHAGAEECFVIEGDLHVGREVLTTGDFQRAEEGSVHGVQSTEHGCTLLITSSLDDELLSEKV